MTRVMSEEERAGREEFAESMCEKINTICDKPSTELVVLISVDRDQHNQAYISITHNSHADDVEVAKIVNNLTAQIVIKSMQGTLQRIEDDPTEHHNVQ